MNNLIKQTLLVGLIAGIASSAHAIKIGFSSIQDSGLAFDGAGNFSFFTDGSYSIEVDDTDGLTGDSVGLLGNITGSWTIDSPSAASPDVSTLSPVSSGAMLSIFDGTNMFTADVDFNVISVISDGSVINADGMLNLFNFSYSGSNSDLNDLKDIGSGYATVSFQVGPGALTTGFLASTALDATFSGNINATQSVPDSASSGVLMTLGLVGLLGFAHRFRAVH